MGQIEDLQEKGFGSHGGRQYTVEYDITPLKKRVLVTNMKFGEIKTAGGIIIPDTAKEKPQEGKVIAAGPGKAADNGDMVKMEVKKGDRILYGKYSGTEVSIEGEEHLIMRESDILAIIE